MTSKKSANQKSLRIIDRFFFNNLVVDKACLVGVWGQTADNKHTLAAWYFLSLFQWVKQAVGRQDFSKPVSKTHLADRSFPSYESFNCFLLFSFQAKIDTFSFYLFWNDEFHTEISSRLTNNIFFKWLLKDRLSYLVVWCWFQPIGLRYEGCDWHVLKTDQSGF